MASVERPLSQAALQINRLQRQVISRCTLAVFELSRKLLRCEMAASGSPLLPQPPHSRQSTRESPVALSPAQLQARVRSSQATASGLLAQALLQCDSQMRFKMLLQVKA